MSFFILNVLNTIFFLDSSNLSFFSLVVCISFSFSSLSTSSLLCINFTFDSCNLSVSVNWNFRCLVGVFCNSSFDFNVAIFSLLSFVVNTSNCFFILSISCFNCTIVVTQISFSRNCSKSSLMSCFVSLLGFFSLFIMLFKFVLSSD